MFNFILLLSELRHNREFYEDAPAQILAPCFTECVRRRFRSKCAQVLDDFQQIFLALPFGQVLRSEHQIGWSILRKNLHLKQCVFRICNSRLVARLVVLELTLDEERLGHPLNVLWEVCI